MYKGSSLKMNVLVCGRVGPTAVFVYIVLVAVVDVFGPDRGDGSDDRSVGEVETTRSQIRVNGKTGIVQTETRSTYSVREYSDLGV